MHRGDFEGSELERRVRTACLQCKLGWRVVADNPGRERLVGLKSYGAGKVARDVRHIANMKFYCAFRWHLASEFIMKGGRISDGMADVYIDRVRIYHGIDGCSAYTRCLFCRNAHPTPVPPIQPNASRQSDGNKRYDCNGYFDETYSDVLSKLSKHLCAQGLPVSSARESEGPAR